MPLKASPDDQAHLLELQAIDTRLQQLNHRQNQLPEIAALNELTKQVEEVGRRSAADHGLVEDTKAELGRIESDVAVVEARIARDTERLDATASLKDVAGLEAELTGLRKRQGDLEEIELEVMERLETLEAAEADSRAESADLVAQMAALEVERDAALATLNGERTHALANRTTIAGKLPADLLALYERQRERYGAGASLLRGGVSSASGVKLLENDMAAIRAAAPDDVILCPDSNAILVRTAESGL